MCIMPAKRKTAKRKSRAAVKGPLHQAAALLGSFRFNKQRMCFMLNRRPMRGVCPFVKKLLYDPAVTYKDLAFEMGTGEGRGGAQRGIAIHAQIARIVKKQYNPRMRIHIKVHAFVSPILRELQSQGWLLVDAEVPVWWQDAGIATCVDFVCKDSQGRYVLIELKTGYKSCYTQPRGVMRAPFNQAKTGETGLQLTAHNEHQTQLLATTLLWNQMFPQKKTAEAYIMHVEDSSTIHLYPLSPTIYAHARHVLACMTRR